MIDLTNRWLPTCILCRILAFISLVECLIQAHFRVRPSQTQTMNKENQLRTQRDLRNRPNSGTRNQN